MTRKELLQELARYAADHVQVRTPGDIAPHFIERIGRRTQEHMVVALLDGAHCTYHFTVVSKGTVNRTLVHPREVYRQAVRRNATAVIVAHNHPSGQLTPSPDDRAVCASLREAGNVIGIPMLDFMVVSSTGYKSFQEEGMLE